MHYIMYTHMYILKLERKSPFASNLLADVTYFIMQGS